MTKPKKVAPYISELFYKNKFMFGNTFGRLLPNKFISRKKRNVDDRKYSGAQLIAPLRKEFSEISKQYSENLDIDTIRNLVWRLEKIFIDAGAFPKFRNEVEKKINKFENLLLDKLYGKK